MLSIYLHGPQTKGFLDLDPTAVLDIESLTELFDEDLSVGEFTLPIDIAWTDNNRRLFGFSERLENYNRKKNYYQCDVFENNFPVLIAAKITILDRSGTIMYSKGKFSASISGTSGLFGSKIKNKKLTDLQLGGIISFPGEDSRDFADHLMRAGYPQYDYISFAPVAIESFFDDQRIGYDGEFLARDTVNTIVINAGGTNWKFGRPLPENPSIPTPTGDARYRDYRTVPFFKLKYVLRKCFTEMGYTVTGAILDGTDFDNLVIFNNYGIENYVLVPTNIDLNRVINPANHVPKMLIADFLKAVLGVFNVYPSFINATDVKLIYRKNEILNRRILSLNDIAASSFSSSPQNNDNEDGYSLEYNFDSADQYNSDRIKDPLDKLLVGAVQRKIDLDGFVYPGLTTDHCVFVEAENMYYAVADATVTPKLWDAYSEKLTPYKTGAGDRTVSFDISPLCAYVEFNAAAALFQFQPYCGTRQPGSYRSNKGTLVQNDFGLRMFYISMQPWAYTIIPKSYNTNRGHDNEIIEKYSLSWHGPDGMAESFHTHWQNIREKAEIVKINIQANQKILADIKAANCFEINSVLYLPHKIDRTSPLNGGLKLELIPI